MKRFHLFFVSSILVFYFGLSILSASAPVCTQDDMWVYVVNNAYRVAEEYATNHNPSSTFVSASKDFSFLKQLAGEHKGKYLLMITVKHGKNTSFAVLMPLFEPNKPSTNLDDNKPLWKVVTAKLNGISY